MPDGSQKLTLTGFNETDKIYGTIRCAPETCSKSLRKMACDYEHARVIRREFTTLPRTKRTKNLTESNDTINLSVYYSGWFLCTIIESNLLRIKVSVQ